MTLTDFKESFASSPECRENFFGEDSAKEYLHAKRMNIMDKKRKSSTYDLCGYMNEVISRQVILDTTIIKLGVIFYQQYFIFATSRAFEACVIANERSESKSRLLFLLTNVIQTFVSGLSTEGLQGHYN